MIRFSPLMTAATALESSLVRAQSPYFHEDRGAHAASAGAGSPSSFQGPVSQTWSKLTAKPEVLASIVESDRRKTVQSDRRSLYFAILYRINELPQRFTGETDPLRSAHELAVSVIHHMERLLESNPENASVRNKVWDTLPVLDELIPGPVEKTVSVPNLQTGLERVAQSLPPLPESPASSGTETEGPPTKPSESGIATLPPSLDRRLARLRANDFGTPQDKALLFRLIDILDGLRASDVDESKLAAIVANLESAQDSRAGAQKALLEALDAARAITPPKASPTAAVVVVSTGTAPESPRTTGYTAGIARQIEAVRSRFTGSDRRSLGALLREMANGHAKGIRQSFVETVLEGMAERIGKGQHGEALEYGRAEWSRLNGKRYKPKAATTPPSAPPPTSPRLIIAPPQTAASPSLPTAAPTIPSMTPVSPPPAALPKFHQRNPGDEQGIEEMIAIFGDQYRNRGYRELERVLGLLTYERFGTWELTSHLQTFERTAASNPGTGFQKSFLERTQQVGSNRLNTLCIELREENSSHWNLVIGEIGQILEHCRHLPPIDNTDEMVRLMQLYHRLTLLLEHRRKYYKPFGLNANQTLYLLGQIAGDFREGRHLMSKDRLMAEIKSYRRQNGEIIRS